MVAPPVLQPPIVLELPPHVHQQREVGLGELRDWARAAQPPPDAIFRYSEERSEVPPRQPERGERRPQFLFGERPLAAARHLGGVENMGTVQRGHGPSMRAARTAACRLAGS